MPNLALDEGTVRQSRHTMLRRTGLAVATLLAVLSACCAQHYQHDLVDLLHFDPFEPSTNEEYPQLGCVSATASLAELRARFAANSSDPSSATGSCEAWARSFQEAFQPSQLLRNRPVLPWPAARIPGGVPKAMCRLGPNVTHKDFTALPATAPQQDAQWLRHYRVLKGRLYVDGSEAHPHAGGYEELLLMAVYLYRVPDMDLWLSFGDVPIAQGPLLQYAVDLQASASGCSMPYFAAWLDGALTLEQSLAWATCIAHRYPRASRRSKAVWRGSTTDPNIHNVTLSNALSLARVRLHMLGLVHSDVLDVKVTGIVQASSGAAELSTELHVHEHGLPFEAFQSYAAVLDIDGNTFSRRMHQLVQMGGPILKQASPYPSYFEHLFAAGVMPVHRFAHNLTDVAEQAEVLLAAVNKQPLPNRWDEAIDNMHTVAAITLNRWSMVESVAYSLKQLASRNSWTPTEAEGLTAIPWTKCCVGGGGLPQELIDAMHAAERIEGPLNAAVYSAADNASADVVLKAFAAAMAGAGTSSHKFSTYGSRHHGSSSNQSSRYGPIATIWHNRSKGGTYTVAAVAVVGAMIVSVSGFVWLVAGGRSGKM